LKNVLLNQKLSLFTPSRLKFLFLLLATLMLTACGNQSDSASESGNVSIKIPDIANKLDQAAGTLTATISVSSLNGGTPQPMTISTTDASVKLSNIPTGSTTITIVFTYDVAPFGPLVVASATRTVTVGTGDNPISFVSTDYDTASFDEDGDGISNILELDESSITSPIVSLCKPGTAILGSCELGS